MKQEKDVYKNVIEFPSDSSHSDLLLDANSFVKNDNVLFFVAMECLKKSNFHGTSEQTKDEFIRIYTSLKKEISNKNEQQKNIPEQTVFDDYIICLEDGKKMQMLNRHLKVYYNMTFQEYKKKWNLPIDYPSTCKNYSKLRANIAKMRKAS